MANYGRKSVQYAQRHVTAKKYGNPDNIKFKKRYSEELICDVFKSKLKYRDISEQYNIPMATVGSIKGLSDAYIRVLAKHGLVPALKEEKKEEIEQECLNEDCKKKFIAENRFLRMCPDCRARNFKTTDDSAHRVHI